METVAQIFLSYSRRDEDQALNLYSTLSKEGYRPWIDVKDILPGENFNLAVERAIQSSDFFIACLSSNSVNERGFVQSQIKQALSILKGKLESDIYLIPVRFEDCEVPDFFRDLQMADLFRSEGGAQLLRAIKVGLERRKGVSGVAANRSSMRDSHTTDGRQTHEIEVTRIWEEKEQDEGTLIRFPFRRGKTNRLSLVLESEHFIVHFGVRNPTVGKGLASDGIRHRSLVNTYLDALENCYEVMISQPWARQPPVVGPSGKTEVFVLDSPPFTSTNFQMVPFICLPSNNNEPTIVNELERAAAEAVHEVVHVFNYRERPYHDPNSYYWGWYDCALASFVERIVLPKNHDYLRFIADWTQMSEIPLDEASATNRGLMFIQYLANSVGLDFINSVWTQAKNEERPFDAISRMLPAGQTFASSDPNEQDIFGAGYCMDSYFFGDPTSDCYMPQAFERYGERAVSESFLLERNKSVNTADILNHLSCKYYRFRLKEQANKLQIRLSVNGPNTLIPLRAEAALVTSNKQRGITKPLRLISSLNTASGEQLLANISLPSEDLDHVVLVVSNCGLRSSKNSTEHDDDKEFSITASAV